jgi:predicted nucleic acid-binding protein
VSGYLIDTNVISEFVKPDPNSGVIRWLRDTDPESLFASVITVGEIRLGIENMAPGKRRSSLETWLETGLPAWFAENLLPITRKIADQWGKTTLRARRKGRSLAMADGLLAATAVTHGLTLVTRNLKDFEGLDIPAHNPWLTLG